MADRNGNVFSGADMDTPEKDLIPEKTSIIQKTLDENKNYFLSWSRKFSSENDYECFKTHLYVWDESCHQDDDIKNIYYDWKIDAFDMVIAPLIKAFLSIWFGKGDLAIKYISSVEKIVHRFVEANVFSEEYNQGITYLYRLLIINKKLTFGNPDENHLYESHLSCSYDELPNQGKSMVLLAKMKFEDIIWSENAVKIMKQIVSLDPENWLWSWRLYTELEFQRRSEDLPSEEETGAILKAVKLSQGTKYHSKCSSYFCQMLALILQYRVLNNLPNTALNIGIKTFGNNEDIVDFIKRSSSDAFKHQKTFMDAKILELYGIMFSTILPDEFQDTKLAMMYEKTYSKIVHENCVGDPPNEGCLTEHVKIYQRFVERIVALLKSDNDTEEINEIFVTVWENKYWQDHEVYSLHFLHCCYFSIKDDVQNALAHWLKMDLERSQTSFLYIDFAYTCQMGFCNKCSENKSLNFDKVLNEVLERLSQDGLADSEKEKLNALKSKLKGVMKLQVQISELRCKDGKSGLKMKSEMNRKNENSEVEHLEQSYDQHIPSEIKECETYFVQWLSSGTTTTEEVVEIINNLHLRMQVPYYAAEKFIRQELSGYYGKRQTLKSIITYLMEAFLHISFGIVDFGAKTISLVEYGINHCVNQYVFPQEYLDGLKYMCNLLTVHLNLKFEFAGKCDFKDFSSSSFDLLPNKGKAIVYFAKYLFLERLTGRNSEYLPILRQMVLLDANKFMWTWELFRHLNSIRSENNISVPTGEEIEAVSKAVELSVTKHCHLRCVQAFCYTLTEIVAYKIRIDLPNTEIRMGNTVFESNELAIAFIKRKAIECLKSEVTKKTYMKGYMLKKYATIFKNLLPFKFRDADFAKICEAACTKLMQEDEERDYKIFLQEKPKVYRSSIKLIQALLENPEKNSEKLDKIFVEIWDQNIWQEHETYSLHFLHGCRLLIQGDANGAVKQWLQMNFQSKNYNKFLFLDFAILSRIKEQGHWINKLNVSKACEEIIRLSETVISDTTPSEKQRLNVLVLKIENAMNIPCEHEAGSKNRTGACRNLNFENAKVEKISCQVSERVQNELEKCETYFINWLGDYEMTKKRFASITAALYDIPSKPDQQTEEEIKEDFTNFSMHTIQNIIAPLVEAFLHISFGNMDVVMKNISWVEYVTKFCQEENVICDEEAEGIKYIWFLVKIHTNLKLGVQNNIGSEQFSSRFENLSDKGKSMIFVAKWLLNDSLESQRRSRRSTVHLQKVVSLDMNNWSWSFILYHRLRHLRRADGFSGPKDEELYAIVRAVDNSESVSCYHARCLSALCQCLAEILGHLFYDRLPYTPIHIGAKVFQSTEEVADYIKATANEAFNGITFSFPLAMIYGEIFSFLLPFKYRDYELAEKCYKLCLEISPSNSKVNHKMGTLQLTWKNEPQQAVNYFKQAVKITPTNFPAWVELIQTLLGHPSDNRVDIEDYFKLFWENEGWAEAEIFSAHFLEGCYLAMRGEIAKALSLWTEYNSHKCSSERAVDFHQLERISKRYKWPKTAGLDYQAVIEEISIRLQSATVEGAEKLKLLQMKIENEIYRQNCSYEYGSTAGFTYPGRPHHHWQSRYTVADKVSSWRMSNLAERPNESENVVPQPVAVSASRYVPPHLRAKTQNNAVPDKTPHCGSW